MPPPNARRGRPKPDEPRTPTTKKTVGVPDPVLAKLQDLATESDVTLHATMLEALEEYVARHWPPGKA